MRLLVMSDSHGRFDLVKEIMSRHTCDYYIHCGDSEVIQPPANLVLVKGNSYLDPDVPYDIVLPVGERSVFITHGHHYSVEFGVRKLAQKAHELGCDIVCYGHTHIAVHEQIDGIFFINPGSVTRSRKGVESYLIFDTMSNNYTRYSVSGEELE